MKKLILAGATDQTIDVFIQDSTSTTGGGKTGLAYNTASLTCYYRKGATGSATQLTLATQTVGGAHSDGGFVEIDATNMPGMYRLDLSDTIIASAGTVTLMLKGATGMAPLPIELQAVAFNPNDAVRLGLTALPNAAADAAGGLPISDAGGLDLDAQIGTKINDILTDTGTTLQAELDGIQADTEDIQSKIGTPAGASLSADVAAVKAQTAAIEADTQDLQTQVGVDGAGLTAVPWNSSWDAEVESEVNDALIAQNLDQLVKSAVDTDFATTVHANSVIGHIADNGAGFDRTTDSLESIRDRGDSAWTTATGFSTLDAAGVRTAVGLASANLDTQLAALPTAAENADAVWDEALSGHLSAGSTGEALNAAGAAGDPWTTALPGAYGAGSAGYIIGNNINATISSRSSHSAADVWSAGTRTLTALDEDSTTLDLDATIRAAVGLASANLDTQLDALPTAAENASAIWGAAARTLTALDEDSTTLDLDATIRAAVGMASANLDTQLSALAGYLDTEVAAILADTNELQTDLANGGRLDLLIDAIKAKTDNLPSDPADQSAVESAITAAAAGIADDVLDSAIEGAVTLRQSIRLANAALGGKASGLETSEATYRDLADTKDRIVATVDVDGNRTAVTRDLT